MKKGGGGPAKRNGKEREEGKIQKQERGMVAGSEAL